MQTLGTGEFYPHPVGRTGESDSFRLKYFSNFVAQFVAKSILRFDPNKIAFAKFP